jgi:hypothetical protein
VKDHQTPDPQEQPIPNRKRFNAEDWILLVALAGFIIFFWIIIFLFFPLLSGRPYPVALPQAVVDIAVTQGFVLPPTWTPGPTQEIIVTPPATQVYDGSVPTRVYTPRPTSLPGVPLPEIPVRVSALDLARILQGESPGDKEAAYYVGWVAKNRLRHSGYGDTYAAVSNGFFGYRADLQPSKEFMEIARQVIRARQDPTGGCLYALSRTDITKLGVPPSQADVTKGEWFFFKTWPVVSNRRSR